jgi:hypothetical protein
VTLPQLYWQLRSWCCGEQFKLVQSLLLPTATDPLPPQVSYWPEDQLFTPSTPSKVHHCRQHPSTLAIAYQRQLYVQQATTLCIDYLATIYHDSNAHKGPSHLQQADC